VFFEYVFVLKLNATIDADHQNLSCDTKTYLLSQQISLIKHLMISLKPDCSKEWKGLKGWG
jgi:hypothetical protein